MNFKKKSLLKKMATDPTMTKTTKCKPTVNTASTHAKL